jgi:hypothetical protein
LELALLQRVLKGAATNDADSLDVKLAMRSVPSPDGLTQASKPFLVFQAKVGGWGQVAQAAPLLDGPPTLCLLPHGSPQGAA